VEIVSIPKSGIVEKPYQCENRAGVMEALAKWHTDKFANVEHPECLHRGDKYCRYIVSWDKTPPLIWKQIRNYFLLSSVLVLIILFFLVPFKIWGLTLFLSAFFNLLLSYYANFLLTRELTKTIEIQKEAAEENLVESNIRYNNALLIQVHC
jgi:hypothetical protein